MRVVKIQNGAEKCKHNESDEISQNILQKFENKSMKEFWSAIRNKNKNMINIFSGF